MLLCMYGLVCCLYKFDFLADWLFDDAKLDFQLYSLCFKLTISYNTKSKIAIFNLKFV